MTLVQDEVSAAIGFFGASAVLTWLAAVRAKASRVVLAALAVSAGLAGVAVLAEFGDVGFTVVK